VFGEPAAAASWAGLVAAVQSGAVGHGDRVVIMNTGSGLKDVAAASRGAEAAGTTAVRVRPDGRDLDEALDRLEMGAR